MEEPYRFAAMGSPCAIRLTGLAPDASTALVRDMEMEVRALEARYSRYRDDSLTSLINRSAGTGEAVIVDEQTAGLLDYVEAAWCSSDGLFDITSGVLRQIWDFRSGRLPEPKQIKEMCARVGWDKAEWQRPRIRLPIPGMEIDFGGVVKEFAVDQLASRATTAGATGGWIELGGDVRVLGPDLSGEEWRIGLHPDTRCRPRKVLRIKHGAIASSGDYERGMWVDGVRYAHVLNPRTGWPSEGVSAVTVIADSCLVAGTASTVAMLQGAHASDWLEQLGLPWLLIDDQGKLSGPLT